MPYIVIFDIYILKSINKLYIQRVDYDIGHIGHIGHVGCDLLWSAYYDSSIRGKQNTGSIFTLNLL